MKGLKRVGWTAASSAGLMAVLLDSKRVDGLVDWWADMTAGSRGNSMAANLETMRAAKKAAQKVFAMAEMLAKLSVDWWADKKVLMKVALREKLKVDW